MRFRSLLWVSAVSAAGLLAGCATGTAAGTPPEGVPTGAVVLSGTCDAQAASYAVGRPATSALQSELITKTLAKTLRVVRPGEMLTQEFSSQRLNLEVDAGGRIASVRCG